MRLILVRHGETEWNAERRYQGHRAIPLNERGRWQAERAAERLAGYDAVALYASDIARAWETAEIIGKQVGLAVEKLEYLREINDGLWAGYTPQELLELYPEHMAAYQQNPAVTQRLEGESYQELQRRMVQGFEDLAERHQGETVIAVSHGGAIRALVCDLLGAPLEHWSRLWVENGGFVEVVAHTDGFWRVLRMNDVAHLLNSDFAEGE